MAERGFGGGRRWARYVSVIPLAQERGPLAARHVAAAVWCLARKPEHWHALVKLGASKQLVAAAEATVTVVLEEAKAKAARLQAERDEAKRKEEEARERAEEAAARGSRPPMRIELDLPWETKAAKEEPVEEHVVAADAAGQQPESTAERTSSSDGGDEDRSKAERQAEAAAVTSESDGEEMEEESPFPPRAPEDGAELRLHTLEWQLAALWLLVCDDAGDRRDGNGTGAATAAWRGWQKVRQAVLRKGGGGGDTGGGGGGKRVSILPLAGVELMLGVLREHANAATAEVLGQSKVMELCAAVLLAVVMGPALAHAGPYLVQVSVARLDLVP